jgi:hypothetical protein
MPSLRRDKQRTSFEGPSERAKLSESLSLFVKVAERSEVG